MANRSAASDRTDDLTEQAIRLQHFARRRLAPCSCLTASRRHARFRPDTRTCALPLNDSLQTVLYLFGRTQAARSLSDVSVGRHTHRFQLNDQAPFTAQVGELLVECRAILVAHSQRILLLVIQSLLPFTESDGVPVTLFKMPALQAPVNRNAGLPDEIVSFYFRASSCVLVARIKATNQRSCQPEIRNSRSRVKRPAILL
jgi:hypothetical protein